MLITHGADIAALNSEQETALHWAALNCKNMKIIFSPKENTHHHTFFAANEKLVDLLIEKGININAKNNDGDTALHNSAMNSIVLNITFLFLKYSLTDGS